MWPGDLGAPSDPGLKSVQEAPEGPGTWAMPSASRQAFRASLTSPLLRPGVQGPPRVWEPEGRMKRVSSPGPGQAVGVGAPALTTCAKWHCLADAFPDD